MKRFKKLHVYLREARKRTGRTQREVSTMMGYTSAQFVSNVERGACLPPEFMVKKMISIYRLDRQELYNLMMSNAGVELRKVLGVRK
jgi:transcriptional regulator with XRE-family HTH domain